MSRAYRIRAAASLTHHSKVDDGIEARLELLDILGPERTGALLGEELEGLGWAVEAGIARKEAHGVVAEVELSTGLVRVTASADEQVTLQAEVSRTTYEEGQARAQAQLQTQLQAKLEAQAREHDVQLSQKLADDLERALTELRPELEQVTDRVTRAALKEKASQMGEIMEIAENPESGEMTIRVKV